MERGLLSSVVVKFLGCVIICGCYCRKLGI